MGLLRSSSHSRRLQWQWMPEEITTARSQHPERPTAGVGITQVNSGSASSPPVSTISLHRTLSRRMSPSWRYPLDSSTPALSPGQVAHSAGVPISTDSSAPAIPHPLLHRLACSPGPSAGSCTPIVPQTPTNCPIQDLTGQVRPPPEMPNSRQLEPTRHHSSEVDFVNS